MRPISQLYNYKIPAIDNAYMCRSRSHSAPGVSLAARRHAAQIILADLGTDFKMLVSK
jgi:beta-carotene ketolase (CrtO type)